MFLGFLLFLYSGVEKKHLASTWGEHWLKGLWGRGGAREWGNWSRDLLTAQEIKNVETQVELGR